MGREGSGLTLGNDVGLGEGLGVLQSTSTERQEEGLKICFIPNAGIAVRIGDSCCILEGVEVVIVRRVECLRQIVLEVGQVFKTIIGCRIAQDVLPCGNFLELISGDHLFPLIDDVIEDSHRVFCQVRAGENVAWASPISIGPGRQATVIVCHRCTRDDPFVSEPGVPGVQCIGCPRCLSFGPNPAR